MKCFIITCINNNVFVDNENVMKRQIKRGYSVDQAMNHKQKNLVYFNEYNFILYLMGRIS